ncbi:MAG: hypothetical protein JWL81_3483 [Verrucomicrobiales bacterium]|nr:hypothetical protein [Verrucomicrobiales bacterium]
MNRKTFWLAALGLLLAPASVRAQVKADPALENVVVAIEPISLRTALARPLTDAKRTVIVPAREDSVLGLTHYSKEEFAAAGLDWDQFMAKSQAAATRLLVSIKPIVAKDASGQMAYIKLKSDRPFTPSVIFSPRLIPLFQAHLGDRIVALVPDRETVYLFSRNFGEFQAFGQKIIDDHASSVYPCSIEAFEISRDGVKCIGGFDDGADPVPEASGVTGGRGEKDAKPRSELPKAPEAESKVPRRKAPEPKPGPAPTPKK